jgi:hypothetical protein
VDLQEVTIFREVCSVQLRRTIRGLSDCPFISHCVQLGAFVALCYPAPYHTCILVLPNGTRVRTLCNASQVLNCAKYHCLLVLENSKQQQICNSKQNFVN